MEDLSRSRQFYEDVIGLGVLFGDDRLCALNVAGQHVLLLFLRGASNKDSLVPGGVIPGHDAVGQIHAAFSVDTEELPDWEAHLRERGIEIISRVTWPRGGRSIYFRDPDGHLLELLTRGVWSIY